MRCLEGQEPLGLRPGSVHLWLVPVDEVEALAEEGYPWLSLDEGLRAEAFSVAELRRRYIGRRAMLRKVLARYTGRTPGTLTFQAAPTGKPFLPVDLDAPRFSLSSSQGWVLLALSGGQEVGVDLEWTRADLDALSIARSFLDPLELMLLRTARDDEKQTLFFRAWTRAEAWLKLSGQGLAGLEELRQRRPQGLWIRDLRLPAAWAGALCLTSPPVEVRWMAHPEALCGSQAFDGQGMALAPLSLIEA